MDARVFRAVVLAAALLSLGAAYRTQNFIVKAPTDQLAKEIGDAAERFRRDLSIEWLGHELPPWSRVCPIRARVAPHKGAGGATSFMFHQGRPFGWQMDIQGSRERILDSVLPHEVTHTIFATHFGQPLPRWADEGACTTVEHPTEKTKQQQMLIRFLTWRDRRGQSRGIPFNRMFAMKEYPRDILPLYAQGYSVARFLIARGGKRKFVEYVGDGMQSNDWTTTTYKHYGFRSLGDLQKSWLDWVGSGSPPLVAEENSLEGDSQVAAAVVPDRTKDTAIYRAQNGEGTPRGTRPRTVGGQAPGEQHVSILDRKASQHSSTGSWYVEQNLKAVEHRSHAKARDVFRPENQTTSQAKKDVVKPETKRPNAPMKRVLLEWTHPDHKRPTVRAPVYFDAPPRRRETVWR